MSEEESSLHPAAAVLGLPELLELILLHLAARELLLVQRVNHTFKRTISRSLRLQRELFFVPDWKRECTPFDAAAGGGKSGKPTRYARKPENNSLLLRAFPQNYPTVTLRLVDIELDPAPRPSSASSSSSSEHASNETVRAGWRWRWDIGIAFPAGGPPNLSSPSAVWRPEASWRKMYLSQPPCGSLHLVRRWRRSARPTVEGASACEGLKMGEFVDAALRAGNAGKDGEVWPTWWIGSDGDWHFEGELGLISGQ